MTDKANSRSQIWSCLPTHHPKVIPEGEEGGGDFEAGSQSAGTMNSIYATRIYPKDTVI